MKRFRLLMPPSQALVFFIAFVRGWDKNPYCLTNQSLAFLHCKINTNNRKLQMEFQFFY